MKRLLKEPLFHFLLLGALLFAGYGILNRGDASTPAPDRIVVSQGQLASILESFTRTRQRPPTREEREGLVQAYVREEVYCREAMALGLDKDDAVIRRRLRQKLEFVSDDIAAQAQATDDQLNAYLQAHPETFRAEEQLTFRQVYLNPEKHGTTLAQDAAQLLVKLNQSSSNGSAAAVGDALMLDDSFTAAPASEIARQFGKEFAEKLLALPPGKWLGPVESSFGVHLVFLSNRKESRIPALAEVRNSVRREWDDSQRLATNEKFYQGLLKHYTVTIEQPPAVRANTVAVMK